MRAITISPFYYPCFTALKIGDFQPLDVQKQATPNRMYLVKSAFRDWSRRFFGFSQGAFRPSSLFSLWARASASMRCSRTSIRSWMATGGPAASCSTSCCCGTDTVPWPSNTMRVGHTREAWRHGRWTASRIRSAPFS